MQFDLAFFLCSLAAAGASPLAACDWVGSSGTPAIPNALSGFLLETPVPCLDSPVLAVRCPRKSSGAPAVGALTALPRQRPKPLRLTLSPHPCHCAAVPLRLAKHRGRVNVFLGPAHAP